MYYFWRVIFWAPNTVCFIQFSPIWLVCALSILIQYNMSKDFVVSVLCSLSLWAVPLPQLRRELRSPTGALHHLYTTHLNEPIHVHHTQVHHLYTKHCYLHCCTYAPYTLKYTLNTNTPCTIVCTCALLHHYGLCIGLPQVQYRVYTGLPSKHTTNCCMCHT